MEEQLRKSVQEAAKEELAALSGTVQGTYEWIVSYDELKNFLSPSFLQTSHEGRLMNLGCGTSELGIDLRRSGYKDVVSVDIDEKQIAEMRRRHGEEDGLSWVVADMTDARDTFESGSFETVVDKATFDALMCNDEASHLYTEVHRVLREGGAYALISFRPRPLMERVLAVPGMFTGGLEGYQDEAIRWWHNEKDPLMGDDGCRALRGRFRERLKACGMCPDGGRLPRGEAHLLMFDEWLRSDEYGYDLAAFELDLEEFNPDCIHKGLTAEDAVAFIKEMQ